MSRFNNGSMPNLSIGQERLVLAILLAAVGAVVWWQTGGGSSDHSVRKFSTTPVPGVAAQLDFTSAEASWNGLRIDPEGNLVIDALTESALSDAVALLSGDKTPEAQRARMTLLLEKQFGLATSQQIMELVTVLKNYQEVEQRWWAENGSRNPPPYEELFQLQDELLGETMASKMFSEHRRLAKMMLASHQIQNDTGLTQAQKDQALMDLQKTFQEGAPDE